MRRPVVVSVAILVLVGGVAARAEHVLAEDGRSAYVIVVSREAAPAVAYAARELRETLREITGAELPIVTDDQPQGPFELLVGSSDRLGSLDITLDAAGLGREGYRLQSVGPHLVLAGPAPRGTLYAVYGFLSDHLGCRWFTPEVRKIPRQDRLVLPELDERRVPVFESREPFTTECLDGDWAARNRMNSSHASLEERHGGKIRFGDGFFVHTFARLVPPETYFQEHPEYFSLVDGKRQDGYAQLCCTNEDVVRICTAGILEAMRAQPDATVFSLSQNDTFKQCECADCQRLAGAEGSQIAPVLALVNRVAEAAEREFPDRAIETLAYQWTRQPPRTLRPRPNVIIRLCSIECCFAHPLEGCDSPENQAFVRDLKGWARISDRLWVWDYVTNFAHYLMPFPNQRVRDDNIQLFARNHVTGIFEQDTYNTADSELAALGGYLTAAYLWNPEYGERRATDEFLEAYYGAAAAPVRAYLDLLHDHVEAKNVHVHIFDRPNAELFPIDLLERALALWSEAEKAVAGDPQRLARVRLGRLNVDYAIQEVAWSALEAKRGDDPALALARSRCEPYLDGLLESRVTRLREWGELDRDAYARELRVKLGLAP